MPRVERETYVGRPPREVFRLLRDAGRAPLWQTNLVEMRAQEPGPLREGSVVTEVRSFLGRRVEGRTLVTECDEGAGVFAVRNETGPVRFRCRFTVEAQGEGSRVRCRFEVEARGPVALLRGAVQRALEADMGRSLERLRRLLEEG